MNPKTKEILIYTLAGVICLGEIAVIAILLYAWIHGVATTDQGVVNLIYGMALGYHSAFMIVMGYFFGSSKSSSDKNDLIAGKNEQTKTSSTIESKVVSEFIPEKKI